LLLHSGISAGYSRQPMPESTAAGIHAPAARYAQDETRRWTIVALLCVAFIIAYLDRQNLSIALSDREFRSFFGLSDNARGVLNSAFFWSYAALQIPAGWLVDRFGVKRPFAIAVAAWSVVAGLTAWCGSSTQLFTLRLLLGAGEAVNTPGGMRWIRLNFGQHKHGLIMGLYQASAKMGPAIGAPLSVWLLLAYGWRWMFIVMGFGAMLWVLPWLLIARDNDRELERAVLNDPKLPQFASVNCSLTV
jgi:MFS transporter, ACS family, D-galactonate transporter